MDVLFRWMGNMEGLVDSIVDLHKGSESLCREFVSILTDKAKNQSKDYSKAFEEWNMKGLKMHLLAGIP